jgi:hypothetical protein
MTISSEIINKAFDYATYRTLIDNLLLQGKVTGPEQSEDLTHYTTLNVHRMNRVDKTSVISEELIAALAQIKAPQTWLVITEGWCGDAAQIVPIFNVIEKQFSTIKVKFILRDENLELMDQFLTNGGRAIPKLLILDQASNKLLAHWGPRPAEAQAVINDLKAANADMTEIKEKLHLWYGRNKSQALQKELLDLIKMRIIS